MAVSFISEQSNEKVLASILSIESQMNTLFSALFALIIGFTSHKYGIEISFIGLSVILILLSPLYLLRTKSELK